MENQKEDFIGENGAQSPKWLPEKASDMPAYLQDRAENSMSKISSRLQRMGMSDSTASLAAYPVALMLLLLAPVAISSIALTATVLLFSMSFLVSTILCSLAVITILFTVSLFICVIVVVGITAAALGATTFVTFAITSIAIMISPLIVVYRVKRRSRSKASPRYTTSTVTDSAQ